MAIGFDRIDDLAQVQIQDELVRRGMSRPAAEIQAARMVMEEQQRRARVRMPPSRSPLTPREASLDADMALAMGQVVTAGNGAEVDNLAAAGTPIAMEPEVGSRRPVRTRVPGPVDSLGRSAAGEPIYDADEAAAYEERTPIAGLSDRQVEDAMAERGSPYRGGAELPSAQDRAMYARGMVPTVNPRTGAVGYSVADPVGAANAFVDGVPLGAPGRLGSRPDLRQPVIDTATGKPIQGTHKYEKSVVDGPLGDQEVYAPSDAFRRELQEREDRMRIQRLAQRAGYTPDSAAVMATSKEPPNLDLLRAQGAARQEAAKAERRAAVVRRAQARYNPLEYMNRPDVDDWSKMVAADALLRRGHQGATPLDVDQATQTALALREQRMALGAGFQPRTPEEQKIIQDKAAAEQRQNDPATAGVRDIQGGNFETGQARDVLREVAKPFDTNWLGGAPESAFPQVKERLMGPPYNLKEEQAAIAAREAMRQTNWW